VWEPFVRLERTPAVAGSGIGLAVVRELVVAHGGTCRVEEAPGGGTRVVVELPQGRRAASAEAA
jgi:signal transduction histidine kinase